MLVKIHNRGVGRGSGPVGYLLGQNRDRADATLLRGDPNTTEQLIDGNNFAQRYTSGVLSFAEADLTDAQKDEIMDSFETMILPGLDADQRDFLWVEHKDKGRLELNFVIPNVELTSGKRLAPYYDRADRTRVNAFQQVVNDLYNLADPHDPARRRALTTANDLPRDRKEAAEAITNGLLLLASEGEIKDREDVIRALDSAGFAVTRETKQSISIATPEGGKPIRLKGAIYERDFRLGEGLRNEIEEASRRYVKERSERIERSRKTLEDGVRSRREANRARYPRPEPEAVKARSKKLAVDASDTMPGRVNERGRALVDWPANHFEHQQDPAAAPDTGAVEQPGRISSPELMRSGEAIVRQSRHEHDVHEQQQRNLHDPEVSDDESRARIIEGIRSTVDRVCEVAERLRSSYQRLIKASRGLEISSRNLEQSSVGWDREVSRADHSLGRLIEQRQAQHQAPRPGPTLGR